MSIAAKLRVVIAAGTVAAALTASAVASAATPVLKPGTITPVRQTTVVAQTIDPNKVGSAGVPGYDDATCEQLANDHNNLEQAGQLAVRGGDVHNAQWEFEAAGAAENELNQNCMVQD